MTDNPFHTTEGAGAKLSLNVGESATLMIAGYKVVDDQFNPGQKVPLIEGHDSNRQEWTLWLSKKGLLSAIGRAMAEAGHDGLPEAGALLTLERLADGEAQPGRSAPHRFTATYQRPAGAAAAPAPAAEAPAPAPAPAAAPAPAPVASAEDFFS